MCTYQGEFRKVEDFSPFLIWEPLEQNFEIYPNAHISQDPGNAFI